jgi:hypothetical protein
VLVGHAVLTMAGRRSRRAERGAVLSHLSSAMLLGLLPVEDRRPEVTIPAAGKCRVEGSSCTARATSTDAERQALLEAHGDRVTRVTWHHATATASQTARRVAVELAGHGAEERTGNSSSASIRTTGTT